MTTLTNDPAGAALATAAATELLQAAEQTVSAPLVVAEQHVPVFGVVYNWWRVVCRSSEGVLILRGRGFTAAEVAPTTRSIFNHAYALHWIADNGVPALDALYDKDQADRESLCKDLERTGWAVAPQYRALLEEQRATQPPAPVRTPAEQRRHNRLKEELRNVRDLFTQYGSPDLYPVYAHLSSLSHTTGLTARLYQRELPDGTVQLSRTAPDLGFADVIQLAIALLQAATVVSPMLKGDPMRSAIDRATELLGLQDVQLLPPRSGALPG
ncbi:DUF5677 domain-containing protein [Kitasatospora sp. NPDC058965]|uniref:DUF5677 domain-containing protein n=1 Tax=Kitasatospora sp. NPDC058965 TaxID=3346682 RepID=UPI0036780CAD